MNRSIIEQAEREFGAPFKDILQGFANDGESVHSTAFILGYSSTTALRRHVKRLGIEFVKGSKSIGSIAAKKESGSTPARLKALKKASESNPTYIRITVDGICDTMAGHARRLGLSVKTVYNRMYSGKTPEQALYTGSYVKQPASNKLHRWRKDSFSKGMES